MSLSENIHVSLRFRPLSSKERLESENSIWYSTSTTVSLKDSCLRLLIENKRLTRVPKAYSYNHCFASNDKNRQVYETVAKRVVMASLKGYNGTLFVYGQTGSGKTFTMMGNDSPHPRSIQQNLIDKGVLIYSLEDLFDSISSSNSKIYSITCSYLEIYNELVYDLLNFTKDPLSVNEDPHKGFFVKGLSEHRVSSLDQILVLVKKGENNRKYAVTAMNHHSSRSHTIFRINVSSVSAEEKSKKLITRSTLNFVDLAGSERACNLNPDMSFDAKPATAKSRENIDTLLNEGKHINTSLLYLCQVISKLAEKTADAHIPYRNSNLTKILKASLGGNSLTCIICTAVPTYAQFEMTLSTLKFGGTAKNITNTVEMNVNSDDTSNSLIKYQRKLESIRREIEKNHAEEILKLEQEGNIRKDMEERVAKLTDMLFNQSRQIGVEVCTEEVKAEAEELWCKQAGDLFVGSSTKRLSKGLGSSKIEQQEDLALMKMHAMHREISRRNEEIAELQNCKKSLLESKVNLKNDLKQALTLCQQLTASNAKHKEKYQSVKNSTKMLEKKLNFLENISGFNDLSEQSLQSLEDFFFHSLDSVKNAKFLKKYKTRLNEMQSSGILSVPPSEPNPQILKDIVNLSEDPVESNSESLNDLESSFYTNDKDCFNSFISYDISTLLSESTENKEFSHIKPRSLINLYK